MSTKGIFFERELNGVMRDFCRIEIAGVRDIWEGPKKNWSMRLLFQQQP